MFEPVECFKGAGLVWVITAVAFHSAAAGLLFAAVPFGFGVVQSLGRR